MLVGPFMEVGFYLIKEHIIFGVVDSGVIGIDQSVLVDELCCFFAIVLPAWSLVEVVGEIDGGDFEGWEPACSSKKQIG